MKYRTLEEMAPVAHVTPVQAESPNALRRMRLERLAEVLDAYEGPFRLTTRIEDVPKKERMAMRADYSPAWVAYQDPVLVRQGLASDRMGDAVTFFDLSWSEAHHLFCDCHYAAGVTSRIVAERVRSTAAQSSLGERWEKLRNVLTSWLGHRATAIGR